MYNTTDQQPLTTRSSNSDMTIVMLQAKVGFINKRKVVTIHCPCPLFIAPLEVQMPMLISEFHVSPQKAQLLITHRKFDVYRRSGLYEVVCPSPLPQSSTQFSRTKCYLVLIVQQHVEV
ncbi:hypothetical protein TNCV_3506701 [Trichonephila clavipes]|uniref:Uncharacterized protein n=1 Tax=Trichonephila clavipes TaxID=2585209 RepID=A0A8X6S1D6_TRICX|nr:hypothetical protein TNCV_3506701 [Trichonephila clavipes]